MGDIGKERKTIEVLPVREPEPQTAPAPEPAPEKEPAHQDSVTTKRVSTLAPLVTSW